MAAYTVFTGIEDIDVTLTEDVRSACDLGDAVLADLIVQWNAKQVYLGSAGHGFGGVFCDESETLCWIGGPEHGCEACFEAIDRCIGFTPVMVLAPD